MAAGERSHPVKTHKGAVAANRRGLRRSRRLVASELLRVRRRPLRWPHQHPVRTRAAARHVCSTAQGSTAVRRGRWSPFRTPRLRRSPVAPLAGHSPLQSRLTTAVLHGRCADAWRTRRVHLDTRACRCARRGRSFLLAQSAAPCRRRRWPSRRRLLVAANGACPRRCSRRNKSL